MRSIFKCYNKLLRTLGAGHRGSVSFYMEQVEIKEIVTLDVKLVEAITKLLNQLVSSSIVFTEQNLKEIVDSGSSQLFLISVNKSIAGMLTLGHYVSPTGVKFWIEDVVIDSNYRGRSLGRKLIDFAINYVRKQGKATLMLTSKPVRVAANQLYQSAGFSIKKTNVYKMEFDEEVVNQQSIK